MPKHALSRQRIKRALAQASVRAQGHMSIVHARAPTLSVGFSALFFRLPANRSADQRNGRARKFLLGVDGRFPEKKLLIRTALQKKVAVLVVFGRCSALGRHTEMVQSDCSREGSASRAAKGQQ